MSRPKNDLDRLFDRYLPNVDREDAKRCWVWQGEGYTPKPYVTTSKKRGHVVVRTPSKQMRVRWNGALVQPNRLLYETFVGPLNSGQRLRADCGCVNPWHQTVSVVAPTYQVPPFGSLDTFIREIIQPDESFDFETFMETWEDELAHIPRDAILEALVKK